MDDLKNKNTALEDENASLKEKIGKLKADKDANTVNAL